MGGRSAVATVVALALGATAVDFAGRLLSTLADAAFMVGVVAVVLAMRRRHRGEVKEWRTALRQEQAAREALMVSDLRMKQVATGTCTANKREAAQ